MKTKKNKGKKDQQNELELLFQEHPDVDEDFKNEVLKLFARRDLSTNVLGTIPDSLFDAAADGIVVHDFDGRILAVNAELCRRLGYEREELLTMSIGDLVYDFRSENYQLRLARITSRKSYAFETIQQHRDGYPLPLEINSRLVDYKGQPAILSIGRDLTARKAAESIMLEQKQFLSAVLEHLPVGLVVKRVEPGYAIHMWNAVMETLTGLNSEDVLGKTDYDVYVEELADSFRKSDQRAVAEGVIVDHAEVEVQALAGSFMARSITVPLTDQDGKVSALLCMMMDVTERVVAEKQLIKAHEELERRVEERTAELQLAHDKLLQAEEHYRALYEQSSEAIFVIDEEGHILHANPAARDIFGYGEQEIRSLNPLHLIHPEEANATPEVLRAVRRGEGAHMELRIRRKDGGFSEVEMSAKRLAGGHVLATIWDITERKQMEQELRAAKVAAEKANEAKSEFLANMSHEIRTPMGGILGMTDLVLSTSLENNQREYLKGIKSASLALLDIINDILDFSKIEANKLDLVIEPFDLASRLESICETFRIDGERKGVGLKARVDPSLPTRLRGDAGRLGQILANLLSNAIKFTDHGHVLLDVSVLERTEKRATVRFSVSDTGIGIAPEQRSKLFDVFSQLDTSFSKRQAGTGLGLAISRRLVEMMGGYIYLESELGKGSCFSFTLFMDLAEPMEIPSDREESAGHVSNGASVRVLLAEDNLLNQEFLTHFLEEAGHSVCVAENGVQVIEALEAGSHDIVLMDIQMPEMDGIMATQHIRAYDGTKYDPTIPIVALTAYAMKGDKERMLAAGMNDYLSKPVDVPRLLALISTLTDNESS